MFMKNLKALHESMLNTLNAHGEAVEHQRFRSRQGGVTFECIFSSGETPYMLSLTSRGTAEQPQSEFFLFEVTDDYKIAGYFGDMYGRLAKLLSTNGGLSGNKLQPNDFLAELDANTPTKATQDNIPNPDEIIAGRPDITEEREKPYWSHWTTPRSKADGSPGSVSPENRKKTAALLGSAALAYSIRVRMSSCWSPTPTHANWRPQD